MNLAALWTWMTVTERVLLGVLGLSLLLAWAAHRPRFAARAPRLAAGAWPYAPLVLLALTLWEAAPHLIRSLSNSQPHWQQEATTTLKDIFGVLWPWFPVLLLVVVVGYLLARHLTPRFFHWTFLGGLALFALTLKVSSLAPTDPVPRQSSEVLAVKLSERVLTSILGERAQADGLSLLLLGGVLLVLYAGLTRINARRDLAPIRVGRIQNGKKVPQPHLEQIMMECIDRSSPHSAPRFPGGAPIYWRRLADSLSDENLGWKARLAGFLMHLVSPVRELQIHGTFTHVAGKVRLSIELRELHFHRTLMARAFEGETPEEATTQAAYAVAETTLLMCRWLPEWVLWRGGDGSALRSYWEGVDKLRAIDPAMSSEEKGKRFDEAAGQFRQAARLSNGNALARLQLAEVLEAQQKFIEAMKLYLDLVERYPHMLIATYRLAAVMLISVFWYKDIAKDEQQWADFKLVLERCRLIQRAKEDFPSRGDDLGIQLYFLRLCEHCLRHLKWVADVRAMGWSLYNPGDRQRFMETLLWPPMKRMAIHRLVMIALKGAELRRCQLEWQANHDDPQARSTERKIERLMRQVDAYGSEAKRAMHRARGFAWGQVHYNLACLYALNIHDPREAVKGVPPSQQLRDDMAQKSVAHLYHALRDPTGPMASGSIWWVFEDPKLTLLREQRKSVFEEWRRVALAESICDR